MRWLLPVILLSTCSVCGQSSEDTSKLHAIVQRAHASGTFDGVVVVSRSGKVIFSEAVGLADRAHALPMRVNTVFRLASETKQVTALLVMQEVEAKHLRLEERSAEVLPGLSATTGRVTIRQLLQHISGLPNPSDGPDDVVPAFYLRHGQDAGDNTKAAMGFCSGAAKRDPDLTFEYNNCDYLVLGALLEKVTGKSYATLVQERVIKPLGLKSWGVFTGDAKTSPKVAIGYGADGKVELEQNVATYGAAGAIYGNALDLAKWDEALLQYKLLSQAATSVMFTADPNLSGEALGSWAYDARGSSGPIRVIERQGDIGGTRLLNNLIPAQAASIVIIANTEAADLFNTYSKKGLGYELLKAVASLQ